MTDQSATNQVVEDDRVLDTGVADAPDGLIGDQTSDAASEPEEDLEEIEHEGKKARVPKELKEAFLRHADYTRKTQEVAAQRQFVEAQQRAFQETVQLSQAATQEQARVVALEEQIGAYDRLNWQDIEAQNPAQAQSLWRQRQQLIEARGQAFGQYQQKVQQAQVAQQQATAKQIEEGQAVLARDIKGWGPERAAQLVEFGSKTYGFTPQELGAINDPRMIKVLNAVFEADKAKKATTGQGTRPAPTVGGTTPATRNPESLSTDAWMANRAKQLAQKARR